LRIRGGVAQHEGKTGNHKCRGADVAPPTRNRAYGKKKKGQVNTKQRRKKRNKKNGTSVKTTGGGNDLKCVLVGSKGLIKPSDKGQGQT